LIALLLAGPLLSVAGEAAAERVRVVVGSGEHARQLQTAARRAGGEAEIICNGQVASLAITAGVGDIDAVLRAVSQAAEAADMPVKIPASRPRAQLLAEPVRGDVTPRVVRAAAPAAPADSPADRPALGGAGSSVWVAETTPPPASQTPPAWNLRGPPA